MTDPSPSYRVAALFVDPKGPYWNDPRCDCWDEKRDARNYRGPFPVVAHPPCQRWTNMTALNFKRYGGEHNRPGNDAGCFVSAVKSVRVWGGVLEHPAYSRAWERYGLLRPIRQWVCQGTGPGDRQHWVCEVSQSAYGHRARKRTWLYYVGNVAPMLGTRFADTPGTHQCGWFDRKKPTLGKREASLTPPMFAEFLIQLAIGSHP